VTAQSLPAIYAEPVEATLPAIAQPDTRMVDLWVNRHESSNTRRNYRRQARQFLAFVAGRLPRSDRGPASLHRIPRSAGAGNPGQRHGRPEVTPHLRLRLARMTASISAFASSLRMVSAS
jgi:hypothetical protein